MPVTVMDLLGRSVPRRQNCQDHSPSLRTRGSNLVSCVHALDFRVRMTDLSSALAGLAGPLATTNGTYRSLAGIHMFTLSTEMGMMVIDKAGSSERQTGM
jgi:hypothetical protein